MKILRVFRADFRGMTFAIANRMRILSLALFACTAPTTAAPTTQGLHLQTPEITLQPGDEVFKCWYTSIPSDTEVEVTRFDSKMTPGSHHFILYATDTPLAPDGTLADCNGAGADAYWVYASQTEENHADMPPGVALPLKAHQPVFFNMHYLNATASPISVHVEQDLTYGEGQLQRAGVLVTYNTQIAIPPLGTQTVSGHCAVPQGAQFFSMSTHSHMRTVMDEVARWSNGAGETLVSTLDWQHPTVSLWNGPYLTFAPSEQLYYQCSYQNDDDRTITVGNSAVDNEMCMAVGYFFPATENVRCLDSSEL